MNNTTVNYSPSLSTLSTTASPAALKQVAALNASTHDVTAGSPVVKADQTSLSLASGLITKALSLPDVRHEKVAGLQKAIAAGTYNVSSHDVAGKLLKSLLS